MLTDEDLTIKELSPETWPDFESLFGRHKGVRGGCWCTFYRCTSREFEGMSRDERKAFQKELVFHSRGCGLLLYKGGEAVAWCQFGPAEEFPRYDRGRDYRKLQHQEKPQWRIACLFVDKGKRGEGLSKKILQAALAEIQAKGGGVVEAFPFEGREDQRPSHTGSVRMYAREGFQTITRLGKNTLLMRCTIGK